MSTGPWRKVFAGAWEPSQAATSTPPGTLVAEAMLGAEPSGTALTPRDPGRTNLFTNSVWAGPGPATGWPQYLPGNGTITLAASTVDLGIGDGSNAWTFAVTTPATQAFWYPSFTAAANTVYALTVYVEAVSGGATASAVISYTAAPAGTVLSYPSCEANPAGGGGGALTPGRLTVLFTVAGTAGTITPRLGIGAAATVSNMSVRLSRPQVELGPETPYIPTTSGPVTVGTLNLTGQAPSLTRTLLATAATLALAGMAPGITRGFTPQTGTLSLAGQAPTITVSSVTQITPGTGSLTLAGQAPSLTRAFTPATGALSLTGQAPTLTRILAPGTAALSLAGQVPSLTRGLTPTPAALALTGQIPSLPSASTLNPTAGALTLAGQLPTLTRGFTPATGALALTGQAPTLTRGFLPAPAALVLNGGAPSLTLSIEPAAAQLALEGQAPTITVMDLNRPLSAERTWPVGREVRALTVRPETRNHQPQAETRSIQLQAEARIHTVTAEYRSITWPPA